MICKVKYATGRSLAGIKGNSKPKGAVSAEVAIIIVQYAGWRYTAACLKSLSRLQYPRFRILVVDNGSQDNSADELEAWMKNNDLDCARLSPGSPLPDHRLSILALPKNLGYAGGNNAGCRLLLQSPSVEYFWLLNNDTEVKPDALRRLVDCLESEPSAGMAGSTLLRAGQREIIQAMGGGYFVPCLGYSKLRGEGVPWLSDQVEQMQAKQRLDFLLGASCLVRRKFLERIGFMDESLFLYFEELDWALRGRGCFKLAYAPLSVVYHHEGASILAGNQPGRRKSALADYYFHRNRLVIVRRYFSLCLLTAYASLLATLLRRVYRRQWSRVPLILKAGWDALWLRKTA